MGIFKKLRGALGLQKRDCRILVVGLDNSGKTTLINHIKPKKASTFEVTPTVGFQVEEFEKNQLNFTIFDMSGQSRYRSLWEHYYKDSEAIIFVIDSTDRIRMRVAKEELDGIIDHPDLRDAPLPILFFANKTDLPASLSAVDTMAAMQLDKLGDKAWHIAASNALTGEGVDEGMEWLADRLANHK